MKPDFRLVDYYEHYYSMDNIDCYIKIRDKNTLVFDLGYLRAGDVGRIMTEAVTLLKRLERPFFTVLDMTRMIRSCSLVHPDDYDSINDFADRLNDEGRFLSFWIVPESSIQYKVWRSLFSERKWICRVDTEEEAREHIGDLLFAF